MNTNRRGNLHEVMHQAAWDSATVSKGTSMNNHKPPEWMFFNRLTQTYDTQDGTKIGIEHYKSSYGITHWTQVPDVCCRPTDALTIAIMREEQRNAIKARGQA